MTPTTVHFTLHGQTEKSAPTELKRQIAPYLADQMLLYHQWRTWDALQRSPLVINTYNTGTGKTRASLLHLITLDADFRRSRHPTDVLFIAPTNALLSQHASDIRKFIAEHDLRYQVVVINAAQMGTLKGALRSGETLKRLLENARAYHDEGELKPTVFIVNPDIFYYSVYFSAFNPHDQFNLAELFISHFDYIVIDEFHYYNAKQFANFLFVFGLFKHFNYFAASGGRPRRICLLSATPRPGVMAKLHTLLPDQVAMIAPDNEPLESADFPTVATLAPLEVTIFGGTLTDWLETPDCPLDGWVNAEGKDGALISSSLARINDAYHWLRRAGFGDATMGRITGPEPETAREQASKRALILATPTVDIGYNFEKGNKPDRQNIDFVVCDARFRDEAIQRIGRAGRVLGKERWDIPAQAVVLVDDALLPQFVKALHGRSWTRAEFRAILEHEIDDLPPKNEIDDYLRVYALQELAHPLLQLVRHMAEEPDKIMTREVYGVLAAVIAPDNKDTIKTYTGYYNTLYNRIKWLEVMNQPGAKPKAPFGSEYILRDLYKAVGEPSGDDLGTYRRAVNDNAFWINHRDPMREFAESQVQLSKALFNFRNSQESFTVVFHDPHHLFSSEAVGSYDLLHILRNYEVRRDSLVSRAIFVRQTRVHADDVPDADYYLVALTRRAEPLQLTFTLDTRMEKAAFAQSWIGKPVALTGFEPKLNTRGEPPLVGAVPGEIAEMFARKRMVCLIVPSQCGYHTMRLAKAGLWGYITSLLYNDGSPPDSLTVYFGLTAFDAHAALRRYIARARHMNPNNTEKLAANDEAFII